MIEFSGEDEDKVIQYLITDMNPKSMADAIPGLPAHILFMCIRHADHVNDDRRMQSLLTNSINSIRKVVKVNWLVVPRSELKIKNHLNSVLKIVKGRSRSQNFLVWDYATGVIVKCVWKSSFYLTLYFSPILP